MTQAILLPHAFANMEVSIPALEIFCQQWGITAPQRNFVYLDETGVRVYFNEESKNQLGSHIMAESPYHSDERRVMRWDDLECIKLAQIKIQNFLETCSGGQMPFLEIMNIYKECQEKKYITVVPLGGDQWHFQPDIIDAVKLGNLPLTDYIKIMGILLPALGDKKNAIQFAWTKICKECGRFYQAKGPKTIFCCETCRSRSRFKTKG